MTWYSSLLGVFANNLDLGRKYAKHERLLYLIHTHDVTNFYQLLTPESHALFCQKHCLKCLMCMPLRVKDMLVSRQNWWLLSLKNRFFVEIIEITHKITVYLRYVCLLCFFYIESFEVPFLGPFFDKIFNKLVCRCKLFE